VAVKEIYYRWIAQEMIRNILLVLVLLSGTGSQLFGQPQQQRQDPRERDPGPITMLLQQRMVLALTPEQVTRLEAIDLQMEEQNRPLLTRTNRIRFLIRRLGDRADMTPEERTQYEAYMAEARPLLDQIQTNNVAAMRAVGEVLTDAQEAQIAQMLRERNDNDNNNRGRGSRPPRVPSTGI
jgi:hypothetical protein